MQKNDWEKIKTLFHQVSALPLAKRNDFLQTQCQGDANLQQAVESLLQHAEQTMELGAIVPDVAQSLFSNDETLIGKRIGHYRLIKLLGNGGMGWFTWQNAPITSLIKRSLSS